MNDAAVIVQYEQSVVQLEDADLIVVDREKISIVSEMVQGLTGPEGPNPWIFGTPKPEDAIADPDTYADLAEALTDAPDGFFYLEHGRNYYWRKEAGTWNLKGSIRGSKGPKGDGLIAGSGPIGPLSRAAFYFDYTNKQFWENHQRNTSKDPEWEMIADLTVGSTWGTLGGTISDSEELTEALDAKADLTYVASALAAAVTGTLKLRGNIDCSANPNYPVAVIGDEYYVTVAGKIGGAAGTPVDVGDVIICKVNSAAGTQAAVGSSWFVLEHNLSGVMTGIGGPVTGGTAGSVPFLGTGGVLSQDNANLSWDWANKHLGIGSNANGKVTIGQLSTDPSYGAIWFGLATPDDTNYSFLGQDGSCFFNTKNGTIMRFRYGNIDIATMSDYRWAFGYGSSIQTNKAVSIFPGNPLFAGLHIRLAAAQVGDAIEVYASDGSSKLAAIQADGSLRHRADAVLNGTDANITLTAADSGRYFPSYNTQIHLPPATKGLVFKVANVLAQIGTYLSVYFHAGEEVVGGNQVFTTVSGTSSVNVAGTAEFVCPSDGVWAVHANSGVLTWTI